MGFVTGTLGFALVAAIVGLCYLLANRRGPFQPGSFLSTALGLDLAYAGSTASASTPAPASTPTSTPTAASTSTAVATPLYSTVNGADMTGSDIPPDASHPGTIAQTTYGPTGCQAICSSDSRCKAAVYQPSTQLCWMKSAVTPGSLVSNADRVFMPQGTPGTGQVKGNGRYAGIDTVSLKVPSATDCSSLCGGLSMEACQASVRDPDGTCHIMSSASGLTLAQNYSSWLRFLTAPQSTPR